MVLNLPRIGHDGKTILDIEVLSGGQMYAYRNRTRLEYPEFYIRVGPNTMVPAHHAGFR
ncbi:hypothetical protein ACFQ9Z_33855 [Streptomyces sp. NPDC056580]|uniref:hypothetical protein n=1 Tax=Streptomyces sp. NPDC056580 TaxID=3345872 RepID=UPI0036CB5A5C